MISYNVVVDIYNEVFMANNKSAEKRVRTSEKARIRNMRRKRAYKDGTKKLIQDAISQKKSVKEIQDELAMVNKAIDKAGKNSIHPNKAARLKSRLALRLNKMGARGK